MILLALDAATARATLALGEVGGRVDVVPVADRRELSRTIGDVTRRLLQDRGLGAPDLGGVVVADGPGSFTGLRIGIAFAKGLCRGAGLTMYAAPSMLGAARAAAPEGGTVVVEYDALRGDVYRAVYRLSPGTVVTLAPPALVAAGSPLAVAGAAGTRRAAERHAGAEHLLALVGVSGGARRLEDPASFEPAYGRRAAAEARLLARGGSP